MAETFGPLKGHFIQDQSLLYWREDQSCKCAEQFSGGAPWRRGAVSRDIKELQLQVFSGELWPLSAGAPWRRGLTSSHQTA